MMPVLNGYNVRHMLGGITETAAIPFLFLMAMSEKAKRHKSMEMGADDYLTKSFSESDLPKARETRQRKTVIKKLYRHNEDGEELITHLLSSREFFGVIALPEAQALDDVELMLMPRQVLQQLICTGAAIRRTFIRFLASKLADMKQQLLPLACNSVRKRVVDELLLSYPRYRKTHGDQAARADSRQNPAHTAATESLIRAFSAFKTKKLIEIKDIKIFILNEKKLRHLLI